MRAIFLALLALAFAPAALAFAPGALGGASAVSMSRRPQSVAGVEMRAPKASTKTKGAKVRSAAAKRMKVTAGGKILRRRAMKQHLLTNKSHKNKKHAGKIGKVSDAMIKNYHQILQA
jgi:large subunit ribosomal protein L35